MRLLYRVGRRLRSLVRRRAVDAEVSEELRFHIERQTDENIAAGMNAADVRSHGTAST